ncbi:hypothetical protein [Frateuria sp. YIM B11624]|uniref:hypothetical protein n=1 Tax=Frateuria sp. YIM B11624 TaxID=3143185 RepID=UPI003C720DCE
MPSKPPKLIAIDHDDYQAEFVGKTADGRQFFLTTPFEPAIGGKAGEEFVALYLFDMKGALVEAKIESFGPRDTMDEAVRQAFHKKLLSYIEPVKYQRIEVAPFSVEKFGTTFGLVPRTPNDEEDEWAIEAQPGNYMAFFEPWDSGEYDT